ncbi:hypothetical protein ACFW7J_13095 [Streptomyces sp. NPDC059525]|uniref:hypothetical protein n=1 Tax=Streptomyces sp. NPDC059525 TaxID=3346857 RepID=UPI0036999FAB
MYAHHGPSARRLLVAALIPLAADAAAQQAWLKSFPIAIDDLMYDFDNALPVFAHEESDEIDAAAVMGELRLIGDHFREMCGERPADPWTYEALATDPAWAAVRDLAREILFVLTGDRTLPMPEINVIPATSDTAAPLPVDHVAP